ncbi:MAG: rhomboid family intramembrane serine protease [Bacteriovoracaceae bacterium]|jgi:membrane associated rhomboid family serine protease|nr:rhomboid family intramembrane serine protease [Bacteriovoracaceae bacterium]
MNQMRMHSPPLSRFNKILIIASVAIFLVNTLLGQSLGITLVNFLGLSSNMVLKGHIYQFLTFPFIEVSFTSILFNCLLLWFIGSELEQKWGQKFYQKFLLFTVLFTGSFYFLISLVNTHMSYVPLKGLDGINLALIVAYALVFSERMLTFMLLFPLKAKYFCLLLAGIEVFMSLTSSYKYSAWSHLLAMGFSYFYLRYKSIRAQISNHKKQKHKKNMRKKIRLVDDDGDDDGPKIWH